MYDICEIPKEEKHKTMDKTDRDYTIMIDCTSSIMNFKGKILITCNVHSLDDYICKWTIAGGKIKTNIRYF